MTNDVMKLNSIVNAIGCQISELAELGRAGFNAPLLITPAELAEMSGHPIGSWRPQSNDLLWFYALKIAVMAGHMLEQSARIFQQMDDDELAGRVQELVDMVEARLNPAETALQVYRRLLASNGCYGSN